MGKTIVITGAAGFLGRAVVNAALRDDRIDSVMAYDMKSIDQTHPKLMTFMCNLDALALYQGIGLADAVIHLAATLGAAAEADPVAARAVNVDATLGLIAACEPSTRFVFASSLAVLGDSLDAHAPTLIYGCHKAMAEIALETASRRGEVDGISLRPGGIVARSDDAISLKSVFLSRMFWSLSEGRDITLPVTANAKTQLSSVTNVAANFIHAALCPTLGDQRSLTLPMTTLRIGDLPDAFTDSPSKVTFAPDPDMMRLFGSARPADVTNALAAGFVADSDMQSLIQNALYHGAPT